MGVDADFVTTQTQLEESHQRRADCDLLTLTPGYYLTGQVAGGGGAVGMGSTVGWA